MSSTKQPPKSEFRARIPSDQFRLIRAIAPLLNSGKDWSYGDIAEEAIADWLKKPKVKALIKKHRLDEI